MCALLTQFICGSTAEGQELEPRAYSAAPVGTNFIVATYTHLGGDVLTDPSLPITDVSAAINEFGVGYEHVFEFAGRSASIGLLAPYVSGDVTGKVFDAPNQVHRAGLGDVRFRFAIDLLGGPALTPEEFARRAPAAIVGTSLTVVAPTGQYEPAHLINVGTNRWAFKPELGVSQPIGKRPGQGEGIISDRPLPASEQSFVVCVSAAGTGREHQFRERATELRLESSMRRLLDGGFPADCMNA